MHEFTNGEFIGLVLGVFWAGMFCGFALVALLSANKEE